MPKRSEYPLKSFIKELRELLDATRRCGRVRRPLRFRAMSDVAENEPPAHPAREKLKSRLRSIGLELHKMGVSLNEIARKVTRSASDADVLNKAWSGIGTWRD